MSFSLSEFARTGGNLEEVLNTHPLLMKLGHGEAPAMRSSNYEDVATLEYDGSYLAAALEAGGKWYKAGDWRCARWPARALSGWHQHRTCRLQLFVTLCCACLRHSGATSAVRSVLRSEQILGAASSDVPLVDCTCRAL